MTTIPLGSSSINISSTVDGVYYGTIVSIFLLGISIVQGWSYFHCNNDKWGLRVLVVALLSLNFAKVWINSGILHYYLISNFGNVNVLNVNNPLFTAEFAITGIVIFLVHLFFATRIYLLTKQRWSTGLVVLCSAAMLICLGLSMIPSKHPKVTTAWTAVALEITLFHVMGTLTDLIITTVLCWNFFKSTRATLVRRTKSIVKHLLVFVVSRGVLIALVQVAHLAMFTVNPTNILFWSSIHLTLSHLYVITMLVMLNSRPSTRDSIQAGNYANEPLQFAHSLSPTDVLATRISLRPASATSADSDVAEPELKSEV